MKQSIRAIIFTCTLLSALILSPVTPVFAVTTPAEINKSFTPIAIVSGGTSVLRVTVYNPNDNPLTDATWTDNLPAGITIADPLNFTNTCGGSVTDGLDGALEAGDTSFKLSGGTVPAADINDIPGSCYVEVDVTSTTPGNLINTLPAGALSSETIDPDDTNVPPIPVPISNTTPASATLNVIAVASPSLSKLFDPNTIFVGQTSRLRLTIRNNDTRNPLTMVTITDTLPTNGDGDVILADPVDATLSGCGTSANLTDSGGGALDPGDTTIRLNDGEIAQNSSCVIEVDVTSLTQGAYTNTIPAGPAGPGNPDPIQTREGVTNESPASAPLNVQAFSLTKAFGTSPIAVGETSQVTITIQNHANFDYTDAELDDVLPDGLEYVNGTQATTCTSGFPGASVSIVTTTNPNDTVRLTNGTLPANSTCTITADARALMSADEDTYTNTIPIGALQTDEGATNHSPATADLDVQSLSVSKAFSPTTFAAGQTSTLTITISNPSPNDFTAASLSDTLPTTPNSELYFTGTPTTDCETLLDPANVNLSGAPPRTVTLTDGTIPGGSLASPGTCTITVQVTSDADAPAASYTNRIPAGTITTTEGGTNSSEATAPVNISTLSVSKAFAPNLVAYPNTSLLTITITNPVTGEALTGIDFTDDLPAEIEIAPYPPAATPSTTCNDSTTPTLTAIAGTSTITLENGSLPAAPVTAQSCTITVYVRPRVTTPSSTGSGYLNTIGAGDVTTDQGPTNSAPANAYLRVNAVSVSKAFQYSSFQAGSTNTLTITLTNYTGSAYTGVSVSDTLPTTPNSELYFTGTPTTTCGSPPATVALSGGPPTRTVTLTNGSIPANSTCTITVTVTTDPDAPAAAYTTGANRNTIPVGALTTAEGPANTNTAYGPVSVYAEGTGVTGSKLFTPDIINPGQNSDLRLRFTAPADTALTGFTFTDLLPTGVTVSNSSPATASANCGTFDPATWPPATGATTITASGGTIARGAMCEVHVWVTSNTGSGPGIVYTNTIRPVDIDNDQDRTVVANFSDDLTVRTVSTLTMDKEFYPTVVSPSGLSTLTITLENSNPNALVDVTLDDLMPGTTSNGVVIAPIPNESTTCGVGAITAVPGTQTLSMINGTIPAQIGGVNGICTISVDVEGESTNGSVPATHTNDIPTSAVTATIDDGSGSTMNPQAAASANLTVRNLGLEIVKGFNPQLVYGGAISELSIILRNPNTTAELTGIAFVDNMPSNEIILADPPNFDPSDCGPAATMSGTAGSSTFSFSGGYLAAGDECTITLDTTMIVNGNRTNTIPAGAVTTFNGATNQTPTSATLTNLAGASISKDFAPNPVAAGLNNYSILTITIRTTATVAISDMGLVDSLPAGLEVAGGAAPAPTNSCGGTFAPSPGDTTVQLSGGSLAIGFESCTLTVAVSGANPGAYLNEIPIGTLTSAESITNREPTDDTLTLTPYSLGNRVWYDTNNDGLLNNGEVGVQSVRVELYRDDGATPGVFDAGDTYISFRNTNADGYYRFDDLGGGEYVVLIPNGNFDSGNPLAGYLSSGTEIASDGTLSDGIGPDADTIELDDDDNGVSTFAGGSVEYVSSQAVTLGPGGSEPTGETNPATNPEVGEAVDDQSNRTVDFGFYRQQLGNLVFVDDDGNGAFGGADTGIPNAQVQLFAANGTTEILVGPDGILGTSDDAAGGVVTDANGNYQFSGLPEGQYVVRVRAPIAYSSTVDTANPGDTANPNDNIDQNDNGVGEGGGQVSSNVFSMVPGVTGTSTTVDNSNATTNNPSLDFGYVIQPYSLGNRVWYDTNNDGLLNNAEVGVQDVRVELYLDDGLTPGVFDAGDTYLSFQTTDASGYYLFNNLSPTDYIVLIPDVNFDAGNPLAGYLSSGTAITFDGTLSDGIGPDPDTLETDSDDNGVTTFSAGAVDYVSSQAVTLGPGAVEPTGESDPVTNPLAGEAPDGQSNRTVDFGFYRQQLGNLVFVDVNGDGLFTGGTDNTLSNARVQLYAGDGTTEILVGPDGILGTADDGPNGVLTGVAGDYLFSGLPQGQYIVKVTPPGGSSTVDTASPGDSANPNNNIDNNDNGLGTGAGQVESNVFNMTPGVTGPSTSVDNSTATTTNPSLDFGFTTQYSLGNRVWYDTDNNGLLDGGEVGIPSVRVELYLDDGSVAGLFDAGDTLVSFQATDADGYYRFDNLEADNYLVVIPADNFRDIGAGDTVPANPLEGYLSSGTSIAANGTVSDGISPDVDSTPTDSDDNGATTFAGNALDYVSSRAVTLGPGASEPTGETDPLANPLAGEAPDSQSNRTVDFGFYQLQLGNQVFQDLNEDGAYDAGDSPFPNVTVQVFASDGVTEINVGPDGILGTADDAPGGMLTDAGGNYLFGGLPEGSYIVTVQPTGYPSTVDSANPGDTANPNTNADNNDNGIGETGGSVSSNIVTLVPGDVGASGNNTVDNATGLTYNPTVDFGYVTSFSKQIIPPDDATHTPDGYVTIGEIITYEVSMTVPVGPLNDVQLIDIPQAGLAFVDCISVIMPVNVVSTEVGTGGACNASDGTDPATSNPLIENDGGRITFDFGDITNNQATPQVVRVQYSLIVLDILANQDGDNLTNQVTWTWDSGSRTTSAPNVEIVEPLLTIEKNATPTSVAIGDVITFTIDVAHAIQSTANAFDVTVYDRIPAGLTYDPLSLVYTGTATLTSSSYDPVTNTLSFFWDVFRLGETATITFQAVFVGPAPVINVANVEWTSHEIDPALPGPPPVPEQRSDYNTESTERWYDPAAPAGVDGYGASDSVTIDSPAWLQPSLPGTGFAPGRVTILPKQTLDKAYINYDEMWLEIPKLGLKATVVGIPRTNDGWDVQWLWDQAGYLEGSAYPTWKGNSVLTGHVYLPDGNPGPFIKLSDLRWGDQVIIHAFGERHIYEVRTNHIIQPTARSPFKHEEDPWLTLLTCMSFDENTNTYKYRIEVRAELIRIENE